jgi:hypothetical protein
LIQEGLKNPDFIDKTCRQVNTGFSGKTGFFMEIIHVIGGKNQ